MKKILLFILLSLSLFCISGCKEKKAPEDISTTIQDEAAWKDAFEKINYNYSLEFPSYTFGSIKVFVTEEKIYGVSNGGSFYQEDYYKKNEEEKCVDYYVSIIQIVEGHYVVEGEENKSFTTLEEALKNRSLKKKEPHPLEVYEEIVKSYAPISFSEEFQHFTYDKSTKTYQCAGKLAASMGISGSEAFIQGYCFNSSVKFENGKIVSISTEYGPSENGEDREKITFFDINTTKVNIPHELLEESQDRH